MLNPLLETILLNDHGSKSSYNFRNLALTLHAATILALIREILIERGGYPDVTHVYKCFFTRTKKAFDVTLNFTYRGPL